ncbi:MAG: hypothetical protein HY917_01030 [Candidatus Diapherotrites archaeon]|nr:hypothetical protein [Candidatus Diapherotrites archaeon]
MPNKTQRTRKKKMVRTPGKTSRRFVGTKARPHASALSGRPLSGVTHGKRGKVNKHSKTQKRPTVPFGGLLNGPDRRRIMEQAARVRHGFKTIQAVNLKEQILIQQALSKIEE